MVLMRMLFTECGGRSFHNNIMMVENNHICLKIL